MGSTAFFRAILVFINDIPKMFITPICISFKSTFYRPSLHSRGCNSLSGFIFIVQYKCRECVWILLLPCSSGRFLCSVFLMIMCSFSSKCLFCCLLELRSIHRLHEMWPMHEEEQGFDYLNCMEKYAPCQNKEGHRIVFSHSYKSGVTALKLKDQYRSNPI